MVGVNEQDRFRKSEESERKEETVHAIAEIQIIPIGVGVSVRKEVMRAHELLENSGL